MTTAFSLNWKDNLNKLIEALDSGQYQQGVFQLRISPNTYCVLGVACDVYSREHDAQWAIDYYENDVPYYSFDYNGTSYTNHIPERIRDWYGLTEFDSVYLANMNDNRRRTFPEFAYELKRLTKETAIKI